MADRVLLTVRCLRRNHLVIAVTREDGELYAEAPRLAAGRKRSSWTPRRWQLTGTTAGWRYGCACGHSWLISGSDITRWLAAGHAEVALPAARIGPIGPVR